MKNISGKKVLADIRLRAFALLVVFVCFYKPPIVEAIGKVFGSTFNAAVNFQSFQSNLATPRAGEQVLPPAVQEMLGFLNAQRLDSYELSANMNTRENMLLRQRIIESAWPIKINYNSKYKLILIDELNTYSKCDLKDRGREASLVFCR